MTLRFRIFRRAAIALLALFALPMGVAMAATDPPIDISSGIPWQMWIAIGLAALAGVRAIVDALLAFFRVEAPMTVTNIDDTIRDDLQLAHDKLDRLAVAVSGIAGAKPPLAPRNPQSGVGRLNVLCLLGPVVLWALVCVTAIQPACATIRSRSAAGAKVALDCEQPNLAAAAQDGLALATQAVISTISGAGHTDATALKGALGAIKGDGLRCAVAGAIAALASPSPAQPGAPAAAPLEVDGAELRSAFAGVRAEWGVAGVRVAGQVL